MQVGILSKVFGKNKTNEVDGLWLQMERKSTWLKVGEIKNQDIELGKEGCYTGEKNTYFVLRSVASQKISYFLCRATDDAPDEILILCNRLEDALGNTIVADDWAIKTINKVSDGQFKNVVVKARNLAGFNAYKTSPPYMLSVAHNANKSSVNEPGNKAKTDPLEEGLKMISTLVDDEGYQNSLLEPPIAKEITSGEALDEIAGAEGAFGFSATNPIPVNGRLGELSYLSRLRNERGERLFFHRVGSLDLVDVYEAVSWSGNDWYVFYLDIYHPRRSRKSPNGFSISTVLGQFTGFYVACSEFPMDFAEQRRECPFSLGYISTETATEALKAGKFVRPDKHRAALGAWVATIGTSTAVSLASSVPKTSSTGEKRQSQLKLLIARGKEQGYLTHAEVNDHLSSEIVDPEQIEDIVNMIIDMGISVFESAPSDVFSDDDAAAPSMEGNEMIWAAALKEYESEERRPGLYAKCFASFDGDEAKTKAAYIKARFNQLKLERRS
jgi:hypothetical protein